MVMRRSRLGMKFDSALSIVVLPQPVPPAMIVETLPATAAARTSAIAGRKVPISISRSMSRARSANFRIETSGPSTAIGRTATLTREPSRNRASTMGDDSSTRRPMAETIRLMMRRRCASSLKLDLGLLQLAEALNIAALVRVNENVGDRGVLQQRFDRSIAGHLGGDLVGENVEFLLIEGQAFAANVVGDIGSNLLRQFV